MHITIDNYPVFIKLGHFYRERLVGQEVLVSLAVELHPDMVAGMNDELDKTLDYSVLLAAIDTLLGDQEIKLIETAVLSLGQHLLQSFPNIVSVRVCIEKPVLPRGLNKGAKISVAHTFTR